jgi:argininosuccinate lyase
LLYRSARLGPAHELARRFVSSIEADEHLLEFVIEINQAHVVMLSRQGIIPRDQARKVLKVISKIRAMPTASKAEDVHASIEELVIRRAGNSAGGNLQLAKSRNDQVATAIRMCLRSEVLQIMDLIIALLSELEELIGRYHKTLFVGRTHLQPAEPITYGHYLMAFHDAIARDLERLEDSYARLNLSPMGGCALAGTSFPIDRDVVADLLGFDGLVENSLDAVGSRDSMLEFLSNMAELSVDISRVAEDFIFNTTPEAGNLQLPKDLSFASSIMPQKKNPDVIELIRAKCAVPIGALSQVATTLHSLPTSYNLDLQEITPTVWASSKAMQEVITMVRILLSRTIVLEIQVDHPDIAMSTATELANILVTEFGLSFRLAHRLVGSAADELSQSGSNQVDQWFELVQEKAQAILRDHPNKIARKLSRARTLRDVVMHKRSIGSPKPNESLRLLRKRVAALRKSIDRQHTRRKHLNRSKARLKSEVLRVIG